MDPDVTETSSRSFFMRDLRPETPLEKLLDLGQHLPGALGWICYRKLKRRLSNRSYAVFDQMLEQIGAGDIVIDLGANVGEITQQMAATGATVHAFEPDPETFTHLQNATKELGNVVLHQAAVGGEDGTVTLFRPRHGRTSNRGAAPPRPIRLWKGIAQRNLMPLARLN